MIETVEYYFCIFSKVYRNYIENLLYLTIDESKLATTQYASFNSTIVHLRNRISKHVWGTCGPWMILQLGFSKHFSNSNIMTLYRIQKIGATRRRQQAGWSCMYHITTLEQVKEFQDLRLVFVDFEKTFDRFDHESIWPALRRKGVSEKLVVEKLSMRFVLHKSILSDPNLVTARKRQGCILSVLRDKPNTSSSYWWPFNHGAE